MKEPFILPGLPATRADPWSRVNVDVFPHPLKPDERGIILASTVELRDSRNSPDVKPGEHFVSINIQYDPNEVRYAALFWDRIQMPEAIAQAVPGVFLDSDTTFLRDEGVLSETHMRCPRDMHPLDIAQIGREKIFRKLDELSPGQWAMGSGPKGIAVPRTALVDGRGLLVRLHNVLPVPNADVSIADVLEFREKHQQEKFELRGHIEDVYQKVLAAPDRPLAEIGAVEHVARTSNDIVKKLHKNGISGFVGDLAAGFDFDLAQFGIAGGSAYLATYSIEKALLTGATAGIGVGVAEGLKRRAAAIGPFKYVASYHRNLAWIAE